jgi:hypothetical protein
MNENEIRLDERERIVREITKFWSDRKAWDENRLARLLDYLKSRAPPEPKPLTKIDTSKFSEQYRWDNICEIAYAVNALVDAVNDLTRRFKSQEPR